MTILKDFDLKLLYLKQNNIMKAEILPIFSIGCMLEEKFTGSGLVLLPIEDF